MGEPGAASPAPYPVQRGLTGPMKEVGARAGDYHRMQVWAGQSAAMAKALPAGELVHRFGRRLRHACDAEQGPDEAHWPCAKNRAYR